MIDLFTQAAQANLDSPLRKGATDVLPPRGRVIMTGDLHDHGLNFQRVVQFADLEQSPDHHVILHEVIHGPHRVNNRDMSVRMLARVAALKLAFPLQVHILQSNHELAQIRGEDILKQGTSVVAAFNAGVEFMFGDDADEVRQAIDRYVRSFLLAVRLPNGILCSHSLPSPARLAGFDPAVLDRVPTPEDLSPKGSGYLMVWGRSHNAMVSDTLGKAWGVEQFLLGHQPAEMGYELQEPNMLVLASDHDHGVLLPVDLTRHYTTQELVDAIIPLVMVLVD